MQKLLPSYHALPRPEILSLVPAHAKRILDVGCGAGMLGQAIKKRQDCYVTGIEIHSDAAAVATKNIDLVFRTNAQTFDISNVKEQQDTIIFADILEHLPNPWTTLKNISSLLQDEGTIIASIPLIDHPSVRFNLQRGLFRYRKAGILDMTHLRFFTQTSIFQMFSHLGLKITHAYKHPSDDNPQQLLIKASKAHVCPNKPKATVIMLTHNNLPYTKQAIASFLDTTSTCCRFIIVDNNSTDGTLDYLHKQPFILTIENTHNLGFATGINTALHSITTPFFVLVNNDILFTPKWLATLLDHMNIDKTLGILGVTSNFISGRQQVQLAPYSDNEELYRVAEDATKREHGNICPYPRIIFICALLKTELLQRIGPLDERFGLGNFEDDDYCLRAITAKYTTAYTKAVYIHHYGHKTFEDSNIDYPKLYRHNSKIFASKWGEDILHHRMKIYDTLKP